MMSAMGDPMTVTLALDVDVAVVLGRWLDREASVDEFKWAASRPGERVALQRLRRALAEKVPAQPSADEARSRLERDLPARRLPIPAEALGGCPQRSGRTFWTLHRLTILLGGWPIASICSAWTTPA